MDDQRCSLPQIHPTENHLSPKRDEGPPRSASFSTKSVMERTKSKEKASPKEVYDSLTLLNNSIKLQDFKYVFLNNGPSTATLNTYCNSFLFQRLSPADQDYLFTLMHQSQRGRMDEQRCSLNVSPKSSPINKPDQSTSFKG